MSPGLARACLSDLHELAGTGCNLCLAGVGSCLPCKRERAFARRLVAVAWAPQSKLEQHHTVLFCLKWALEGMLFATSEAARSEAA